MTTQGYMVYSTVDEWDVPYADDQSERVRYFTGSKTRRLVTVVGIVQLGRVLSVLYCTVQ